MARSVWPKIAVGAALFSLAGCGWLERAERPAWRAQAENYCLARDLVKPSAYVAPQPEIDGPSICGLTHPFKVSALAEGTVAVDKNVTIGCPLVVALEGWLAEVVQPYAQADFGQNVVELEAFGAYSCVYRGMTIGSFFAFASSVGLLMGPLMGFLNLNLVLFLLNYFRCH